MEMTHSMFNEGLGTPEQGIREMDVHLNSYALGGWELAGYAVTVYPHNSHVVHRFVWQRPRQSSSVDVRKRAW